MDEMNDAIRLRILELRESRNWTQEDLARKLQVNLKTIYHWESGTSSPSASNTVELCKLFSISSDYLLGIESNNAIRLDGLSEKDKVRFVAMFQAYINQSELLE